MKRRGHSDGGIDQRGEDSWRIRYRVNGKRFAKTVAKPLFHVVRHRRPGQFRRRVSAANEKTLEIPILYERRFRSLLATDC